MPRRGELQGLFTFGDRVPAAIGLVLALMAGATVVDLAADHRLANAVGLLPGRILQGEAWRLVTWPFVQDNPLDLLFGGFMMWWLGRELSYVWSERRLLLRFLAYALFAGVVSTLLALAGVRVAYVGVWPVANAFLVSWALLYPDRQINVWGVLPITGRTAAWLVLGGTVLYGLQGGLRGLGGYAPHFAALALAWLLSRGFSVRRPWRNVRSWLDEREQKRRASHLKVVKRDDDRPRWLN